MTAIPSVEHRAWLEIWTRPRATIRWLVGSRPHRAAGFLLAAAWGIVQSLLQGQENNVGARGPLALILLAIPIGALWGIVQLYVLTTLVYMVGRWTGAPARFGDLRTAISWAYVPAASTLILWALGTLIYGRTWYLNPDAAGATGTSIILAMGIFFLASFVAIIWTFVILVNGVAEVQGITAWQAIGHILGGLVILAVTVVLPLMLVMLVT